LSGSDAISERRRRQTEEQNEDAEVVAEERNGDAEVAVEEGTGRRIVVVE